MMAHRPILDFTDAQLEQLLGDGMLISANSKLDPVQREIVEWMLELALRIREIRRYVKLEATTHNGATWVRADRMLELLDGG